jgi:hypothetical protein
MKSILNRNATVEIIEKIHELGIPAAAEFFETTTKEIERTLKTKKPSLEAWMTLLKKEEEKENPFGLSPEGDGKPTEELKDEMDKIVAEASAAMSALQPLADALRSRVRVEGEYTLEKALQAVLDGKWSRKLVILFPTNRDVNPHVMFSVLALVKKLPWVGFQYKPNTIIQRSRNLLAHDFLTSEAEWAMWIDSDVIVPFGEPGFFYNRLKASNIPPEFLSVTAPQRLLSHGKKLVGGVYARRGVGDGLCIQPALHPRNAGDKGLVDRLTRGPFNELFEVDYIATGCALVHRSVFDDIKKMRPDLQGAEGIFDFFGHDANKEGEDVHFCKLAKAAGHQAYLDCGCFCGHVGNYCFFP